MRILVVDDESSVRSVLRSGLESEGFEVFEAGDESSLFDVLQRDGVDLITLDLGLGSADGLQLAREIRTRHNVPIVMITGRAAAVDRITGLEHGADDYIPKPFAIREVALRIRNVLKRYASELSGPPNGGEPIRLSFDHGILDRAKRHVVKHDGSQVELTEIEFRLLELFVTHPTRVLSRDDIALALHGRPWAPLDRTIDGHVARLRRKIEPLSESPILIKSVRGVGYVFVGDVKSV